MIPTYSSYIASYLRGKAKSTLPPPGEHHFVSAYLVPKLYSINQVVPDYINPDGTKEILGDVVYYRDGRHHIGIEVKLGTIRLTRREFNDWIVASEDSSWPTLFVGLGQNGIALAKWSVFRAAYIAAVQKKIPGWLPKAIPSGYGPTKSIDTLLLHLPASATFPFARALKEATENELRFSRALRESVGG